MEIWINEGGAGDAKWLLLPSGRLVVDSLVASSPRPPSPTPAFVGELCVSVIHLLKEPLRRRVTQVRGERP